ncbi:MAG TPA: glycosyltransferase family 1 protein [Anaeromyxobacteraceae bacterium]|nr:glycosyltransferase family 1 protein [Anaeromyxobacteraceae bacterium]
MRIGIDATLVRPDRLTGIERYALSLIAAMARRAPGDLVLFTRPNAPPALTGLPVEQHRSPFKNRFSIEQLWLPMAAARARIDLLHMLAFPTPPLWRGLAAITVHDATPWLHRDTISRGMRYYYGPLYQQALRRAAGILTVSESSRRDLVETLGVAPEHVHVTHNGVLPLFFEARRAAPPPAPYLLAVGTLEPRKNIPVLLQAFRLLRAVHPDLQLVLVGRQGWAGPLPLDELAPWVRLTGAVPDTELSDLYAGAACFVLPSLYEGFGISLCEAMAASAPAVASDIGALREVGGDTVLYASPRSPGEFAARICEVLAGGPALAERLARARARARAFSWETCAEETLGVYAALTGGRRRVHPA